MKENSEEELQSRRQFFKKAAKKALPILGAIALANMPIIARGAESTSTSCHDACTGTCRTGCSTNCYNQCYSTCKGSCSYTCRSSCSGSCNGR
ncbi:MAG: Cys-Xaa-Xaa-Xaa repeat radical SAM target protein [Muribaculaceae bacterium]